MPQHTSPVPAGSGAATARIRASNSASPERLDQVVVGARVERQDTFRLLAAGPVTMMIPGVGALPRRQAAHLLTPVHVGKGPGRAARRPESPEASASCPVITWSTRYPAPGSAPRTSWVARPGSSSNHQDTWGALRGGQPRRRRHCSPRS